MKCLGGYIKRRDDFRPCRRSLFRSFGVLSNLRIIERSRRGFAVKRLELSTNPGVYKSSHSNLAIRFKHDDSTTLYFWTLSVCNCFRNKQDRWSSSHTGVGFGQTPLRPLSIAEDRRPRKNKGIYTHRPVRYQLQYGRDENYQALEYNLSFLSLLSSDSSRLK